MSLRSLAQCGALLLAGCSSFQQRSEPVAVSQPIISGVVLRVTKNDTTPVAGANVWTNPQSDNVKSNESGQFTITEGLIPGTYAVVAEAGGVQGRSSKVETKLKETSKVVIVIGVADTTWPPDVHLDRFFPRLTPRPGGANGTRTSP